MRHFTLLLLLIIACKPQETPDFTIKGTAKGLKTDKLLLVKQTDIERKQVEIIDTIHISEEGAFEAGHNEETYYYTLQVDESRQVPLLLNKGQTVTLNITKDTVTVSGSKDTDLYNGYERFRERSLEQLVKNIRRQITVEQEKENPSQKVIDSLGILEIANYRTHIAELNRYIKDNLAGSIALYPTSLRWTGDDNVPFYEGILADFQSKYPDLSLTKKLEEKVQRLKQTAVGGTVPNISLPNAEGQNMDLYNVKQKYTIIDFWASWCGPCRRESDLLFTLYEEYKGSGLEIYGISLDTNGKLWKNALDKDRRIWPNVSSLEGFKTKAAFDYTVTALPMNFIIDANGRILSKDLHGAELEEFVNRLFR